MKKMPIPNLFLFEESLFSTTTSSTIRSQEKDGSVDEGDLWRKCYLRLTSLMCTRRITSSSMFHAAGCLSWDVRERCLKYYLDEYLLRVNMATMSDTTRRIFKIVKEKRLSLASLNIHASCGSLGNLKLLLFLLDHLPLLRVLGIVLDERDASTLSSLAAVVNESIWARLKTGLLPRLKLEITFIVSLDSKQMTSSALGGGADVQLTSALYQACFAVLQKSGGGGGGVGLASATAFLDLQSNENHPLASLVVDNGHENYSGRIDTNSLSGRRQRYFGMIGRQVFDSVGNLVCVKTICNDAISNKTGSLRGISISSAIEFLTHHIVGLAIHSLDLSSSPSLLHCLSSPSSLLQQNISTRALCSLNVSKCGLGVNALIHLMRLCNPRMLRLLDISGNVLSKGGGGCGGAGDDHIAIGSLEQLGKAIAELIEHPECVLKRFNVSNNHFSVVGLQRLVEGMRRNRSLIDLNLTGIDLSSVLVPQLADALLKQRASDDSGGGAGLKRLSLRNTHILPRQLHDFLQTLFFSNDHGSISSSSLSSLEYLDVGGNAMNESIGNILQQILSLPNTSSHNLEQLCLNNTSESTHLRLGEQGCHQLIMGLLANNNRLLYLGLAGQDFNDENLAVLMSVLPSSGVAHVDLSFNLVSDDGIDAVWSGEVDEIEGGGGRCCGGDDERRDDVRQCDSLFIQVDGNPFSQETKNKIRRSSASVFSLSDWRQ